MTQRPRIAFIDLETAPNLGWTWGKWEQNVIDFKTQWYLLSFAVKWQGEKRVRCYKLPDYKLFKKDKENDRDLVKDLWSVFDEADVIVAHNGNKFDIKKSNARFIYHNLPPPSFYKKVDTLVWARGVAAFTSNKLDDLARDLKLGIRKLPHQGAHTWFGCMSGDPKAWDVMERYNSRDCVLLEGVYEKLKSYAPNHPNLNLYTGQQHRCPTCQSSRIKRRGMNYGKTTARQRWQCLDCWSAWSGDIVKGGQLCTSPIHPARATSSRRVASSRTRTTTTSRPTRSTGRGKRRASERN